MSDKKEHRKFCERINQGGQESKDKSTNYRTEKEIRNVIKDEFIKAYRYGDILDRLTGKHTEEELDFIRRFCQCSEPPEEEEHPELRFTPSMRDAEKIYRNSGLPGIPAFDIWFSEEKEK